MLSVIIWNWEINLHCIFGLIIHYMSTVSAGDNCNCNVRKRKIWNVSIFIFEWWGIVWRGEWNTFSRSLLTQFLSGITQNWFIETKTTRRIPLPTVSNYFQQQNSIQYFDAESFLSVADLRVFIDLYSLTLILFPNCSSEYLVVLQQCVYLCLFFVIEQFTIWDRKTFHNILL